MSLQDERPNFQPPLCQSCFKVLSDEEAHECETCLNEFKHLLKCGMIEGIICG